MKPDSDLAWELIGQDPVLRLELNSIEQRDPSDGDMIAELMEFFARIERMIKLAAILVEEDFMITR